MLPTIATPEVRAALRTIQAALEAIPPSIPGVAVSDFQAYLETELKPIRDLKKQCVGVVEAVVDFGYRKAEQDWLDSEVARVKKELSQLRPGNFTVCMPRVWAGIATSTTIPVRHEDVTVVEVRYEASHLYDKTGSQTKIDVNAWPCHVGDVDITDDGPQARHLSRVPGMHGKIKAAVADYVATIPFELLEDMAQSSYYNPDDDRDHFCGEQVLRGIAVTVLRSDTRSDTCHAAKRKRE